MPGRGQEFCHVLPHAVRLLLVLVGHVLAAACWGRLGAVSTWAVLLSRVGSKCEVLNCKIGVSRSFLIAPARSECVGPSEKAARY